MKPNSFRVGIGLATLLAGILAAQAQTTITMSNLWTIAAGSRPYVSGPATNTERGIAINPVNGHVYVVSRNGGLQVAILDGETGAELGFLPIDGVSGGTFALSCIGVADDGVIYGANLTGGPTVFAAYKIYRWTAEDAIPELMFGPAAPGVVMARYGDAFDVRGSGLDTQIVASGSTAAAVTVFTTLDGTTFEATEFALTGTGIGNGELGKGLCFGEGDTLYGRTSGSALVREVSFSLASRTLTKVRDIPALTSLAPIVVGLTNKVLAAVQVANAVAGHNLNLYDLSDPGAASLPLLGSLPFPTPNAADANLIGAVDMFGTTIAAVEPNNGVICARVHFVTTIIPPGIASEPVGANVLEGGYYSMTVAGTGTKPLGYQWYLNDLSLTGKTASTLALTNVTIADAGIYRVVLSNAGGSITSAPVAITITPTVRTEALTPAWSLPTGSVNWLTADNTCRSIAYNPATGNLLALSRAAGTNAIYVINSANGQVLRTLNTDPTIVFGGTFPLNMVGVADDGAVFACNLTTAATSDPFVLYRWDNDTAEALPVMVFNGNPANGAGATARYGDTMDVRGSGLNTQILLASRAAKVVCVLTTSDGINFGGIPVEVAEATDGDYGLGACFGADNSFWGKAAGRGLAHIGFDLTGYDPFSSPPVAGTILHNYGTNVISMFINNIIVNTQSNLLAAISTETPDNARLYDLTDLSAPPVLLDTEFFSSDNGNINGTGALDFGGDKLFALDTNNGIIAYAYRRVSMQPSPISIGRVGNVVTLTWTGGFKLQSAPAVTGPFTPVDGATSPHPVDTAGAAKFYRLSN